MSIEVLVATMNKTSIQGLVKSMKIKNYVIINQITTDILPPKNVNSKHVTLLSFSERGLSKSRNKAIENSKSDICVVADDDMYYVNNYEVIISKAYEQYPDADIIAFYVDSAGPRHRKKKLKEGRVSLLQTMKLASWNITFKRQSIVSSNILFDESFGTGTKNFYGEDNIFLFDCAKKKLKIYYVPTKIATLLPDTNSTWFKGHTEENYMVGGAVYYRMSHFMWPLLITQFALRKRKLFDKNLSAFQVIRFMFTGAFSEMRRRR